MLRYQSYNNTKYIVNVIIVVLYITIASGSYLQNDDLTQWACGVDKPAAITNSPDSIRTPQENGSYMLNQECHWLVTAPLGKIVKLNFSEYDLESTYPCLYASVTVYDGDGVAGDVISTYCGLGASPGQAHTSLHQMYVVFTSQGQGGGAGFFADIHFIDVNSLACGTGSPAVISWSQGGFVSPDWPDPYPANVECTWLFNNTQDIRVEFVEWLLRPPDHSNSCHDSVVIYDGASPTSSPLLGQFCGDDVPPALGKSNLQMLVMFKSQTLPKQFDGRFHLKFTTMNTTDVACGPNQPVDVDWSPGHIRSPSVENSECAWRITAPEGKVVRFEIEYFDLPRCSNCGCAKLTIYNGVYFDARDEIGTYCSGGWLDSTIQTGGSTASVTYDSYKLQPHAGISVKYTFFDFAVQACSGDRPINLTHDYGIVASPGYDKGHYPDDVTCQWTVLTEIGKVVEVHFLTFDVEPCPACQCDAVTLYNGPAVVASRRVVQVCDARPQLFWTSLPGAVITFTSDQHNTRAGFKLEYEIKNLSDIACGQNRPVELFLGPGDILSPHYGQTDYPLFSYCQWLLSSVHEKRVQLTFVTFNVEYDVPERCLYDRVTVYDGDTPAAPVLGQYCGREVPAPLTSSQRHMLVQFTSNHVNNAPGFHLKFEHVDPPSSQRRHLTLILGVVLGVLLAGIVVTVVALYCTKPHVFKQSIRRDAPRAPSQLGLVLRNHTAVCSDGVDHGEGIETGPGRRNLQPDIDNTEPIIQMRPRSRRPPSYETTNQTTSNNPLNAPPPTYEESLGHRIVHNGNVYVTETSFTNTTVSMHHRQPLHPIVSEREEASLSTDGISGTPTWLPSYDEMVGFLDTHDSNNDTSDHFALSFDEPRQFTGLSSETSVTSPRLPTTSSGVSGSASHKTKNASAKGILKSSSDACPEIREIGRQEQFKKLSKSYNNICMADRYPMSVANNPDERRVGAEAQPIRQENMRRSRSVPHLWMTLETTHISGSRESPV